MTYYNILYYPEVDSEMMDDQSLTQMIICRLVQPLNIVLLI